MQITIEFELWTVLRLLVPVFLVLTYATAMYDEDHGYSAVREKFIVGFGVTTALLIVIFAIKGMVF